MGDGGLVPSKVHHGGWRAIPVLHGGGGPHAGAAQVLSLTHPPQQIPLLHQQLLILSHHRPNRLLLLEIHPPHGDGRTEKQEEKRRRRRRDEQEGEGEGEGEEKQEEEEG